MSWTTHDLLSLDWCRWHEYYGMSALSDFPWLGV